MPLVSDLFTDVENTTLPNHVPNIRPAGVVWQDISGNWNIKSNQAAANAAGQRIHAVINAGEADVITQVTVTSTGTGTGVNQLSGAVTRWTASTDYWLAGYAQAEDVLYLIERNANVATVRGSVSLALDTAPHVVTIAAEAAELDVAVDGTPRLSYASATHNQTATRHGMMLRVGTDRADTFSVEEIAVAPIEIDMPPLTIPIVQVEPTIALGLVIGMPSLAIPIVLVSPAVSIGGGATADAVEQRYYLYVADDGSHWAVKVDRTWGEDPDSGAADWIPGTPTMTKRSNVQARRIVLQDPVSGRWTTRVVFRPDATAWVTPGFTTQIPIRGAAGLVTVQLIERRPEWIPRPHAIHHKPEPTTV